MSLEIRSNGSIFIAGEKGSNVPAGFEFRDVLKSAGFWWHGGPCKPGCKACQFNVPKMWWTSDPAKAARLRSHCDANTLKAIAPILVLTEKSRATESLIEIPCPEGLAYDGFQKAGVEFVLDVWTKFKGALIADEMGLGKTVQALALMNLLNEQGDGRLVAVICPKSVVLNWKREAERWLDNNWEVNTHEDWTGEAKDEGNRLVIWSYSQVTKFPKGVEFDLLVFDEAHYIKNPDAQRTQEAIPCWSKGKPVEGSGRIAAQATKLLFLTGTPILNRHVELQTLLSAIDPSFAGFWYLKKFCGAHRDAHGNWDFSKSTRGEELQNSLRSKFMVRRLKKDVYKDLPPKRHTLIPLELTSGAKAILKKAGPEESFESAIKSMDAGKPWGHPAQVRHDLAVEKTNQIAAFVEDLLENTDKVIVFGFTIDAMKWIATTLVKYNPRVIIGETKLEERQAAVDAFQTGDCRVIIGGYEPMGVGLTLTASSTVVFSEPAWRAADVSQAVDRAHRRGQTEMVNAYYLMYVGTLEAKMMQMVINKQEIADKALDRSTEIYVPESQVCSLSAINQAAAGPMFTPEERSLIHRALKFLAKRCDGAAELDGQGFSKVDKDFGHSLAGSKTLSDKQVHFGKRLCKKYRRQLEAGGISTASLE